MISERHLWAAVLDLAMEDLTDRRIRDEVNVRGWFTSNEYVPGSFLWICDHLELDASTIRRRVWKIAEQHTLVSRARTTQSAILPVRQRDNQPRL
jgi:hypothetical protein